MVAVFLNTLKWTPGLTAVLASFQDEVIACLIGVGSPSFREGQHRSGVGYDQ